MIVATMNIAPTLLTTMLAAVWLQIVSSWFKTLHVEITFQDFKRISRRKHFEIFVFLIDCLWLICKYMLQSLEIF